DVLKFPIAESFDIKLLYGNQTVSSNWTHIFSEKLFSNFVVTGSRYFNFPEFNLSGTSIERNNNIFDFSVKGDIEYFLNDQHSIKAGVWGGLMTLKLEDRFDNEQSFYSRIQSKYSSFYVQDTWKAT